MQPASAEHEPGSPELALVDPELRRRLIERLEAAPTPTPATASSRPRPRRARRIRVVAGGLAAAALAAVSCAIALAGDRARGEAAPPRPKAATVSGRPVFGWARVSGASGYEVEIRRGEALVLSMRTLKLQMRVPSRLSPGTYHWYVWPIESRARTRRPAAIVASTFAVAP